MDYITPIKDALDQEMFDVCNLFIAIGTPSETPRYFNFRDFDEQTKVLRIGSTQRDALWFEVQTEFNHVECHEFWDQFRRYRTEFLTKYYPTIKTL